MTEAHDVEHGARRTTGRRLLAVVLTLAVLLAGGWWSTHPSRFSPVGDEVSSPAHIGEPLVFGVGSRPTSAVVLRDVRARILENTADATVRVVFCQDGPPFGAASGTVQKLCRRIRPLSGAHLGTAVNESLHLVIEVTPQRPGNVVIDGVDVDYRSGLRWGSEATGIVIRLKTVG